jgi:hypothetical protein
MAKYEVVEIEKNTRHEDGTPIVNDRWTCESATDAFLHVHVRRVEAEIQDRTDVRFEAHENGEKITGDVPDDDVVYKALAEMGYTENEILSVL